MEENDCKLKERYELIEHLKLIEQQIQRMADNSFKVKNWALTVIGGALLYWLKEETPKYNLVWLLALIMLATIIFWWLDAYYLTLEKCYRKLYVDVQKTPNYVYSLTIKKYLDKISIEYVMITSKTYTHVYIPLIIFEVILFLAKYVKIQIK